MKPTIKPHQAITIHRDSTVSFFDITSQQWRRIPACHVTANMLATLPQEDRDRIRAAAAAEYSADTRILCDLGDADFRLGGYFDDFARANGHCSGKSAADDLNLWEMTVAEAVAIIAPECFRSPGSCTTLYSVQLTQHGSGIDLASFPSEADAVAYAEEQWQINHDHPDFIRGGESRAEWSIWSEVYDDGGYVVSSSRVWSRFADEKL